MLGVKMVKADNATVDLQADLGTALGRKVTEVVELIMQLIKATQGPVSEPTKRKRDPGGDPDSSGAGGSLGGDGNQGASAAAAASKKSKSTTTTRGKGAGGKNGGGAKDAVTARYLRKFRTLAVPKPVIRRHSLLPRAGSPRTINGVPKNFLGPGVTSVKGN